MTRSFPSARVSADRPMTMDLPPDERHPDDLQAADGAAATPGNGAPTAGHEAESDLAAVQQIAQARADITRELEKRIVGQHEVVEKLLVAMFARGHCLFVGVPGLAKTLLVSTLAEVLNLSFNRIQ